MDTQSLNALKPGVYVIGKILSCTAALFNRKDGTGQFVVTRLEVATKPGVVTIERIFDPAKDAEVKVANGQVTAFPTYPEDATAAFRVDPEGIKESKGKVRINRAEKIA